jgi:hypothetical protein
MWFFQPIFIFVINLPDFIAEAVAEGLTLPTTMAS